MWLEVKSPTRRVRIELEDEDGDSSWFMMLIPTGSTDMQVIDWARRYLPSKHLAALCAAIKGTPH
jgi:hypothetical protein